MSDIRLFRFSDTKADELAIYLAQKERDLHELIENHMEIFLGVRFLAHEYSTGKNHRGRIDSLGLDENDCPVIIEYKRHCNENVINQGLFYLDWLFDHKADFKLLVMEKLGHDTAAEIEWDGARVLCIASDFTRYDEYAVGQIGRNIELIKYKYFADDLLLLEWINPVISQAATSDAQDQKVPASRDGHELSVQPKVVENKYKYVPDILAGLPDEMEALYNETTEFISSLGDDINIKILKRYIAFSKLKNFVCLAPSQEQFRLWLKLDPKEMTIEEGFSRDMSERGHWGTGDVELNIHNLADLEKAKPYITKAYQEN